MQTKEAVEEVVSANGRQMLEEIERIQEEKEAVENALKFDARIMLIRIEGEPPGLLTSRFTPEMLQAGTVKMKGMTDDVCKKLFEQSRYRDPRTGNADCFIARALKKATAVAGQRFYEMIEARVYGLIRIPLEYIPLEQPESLGLDAETEAGELVPLWPEIRKDAARNRNARGNPGVIAVRAHYETWAMQFPVVFWANKIKPADVVRLFSIAGNSVGIGAWRLEKGGDFGGFVVTRYSASQPYDRWGKKGMKKLGEMKWDWKTPAAEEAKETKKAAKVKGGKK